MIPIGDITQMRSNLVIVLGLEAGRRSGCTVPRGAYNHLTAIEAD